MQHVSFSLQSIISTIYCMHFLQISSFFSNCDIQVQTISKVIHKYFNDAIVFFILEHFFILQNNYNCITYPFIFFLFFYLCRVFSFIFLLFVSFYYNNISLLLQLCILSCFMYPIFSISVFYHFPFLFVETVDNFVNNLNYLILFHSLFTFHFG